LPRRTSSTRWSRITTAPTATRGKWGYSPLSGIHLLHLEKYESLFIIAMAALIVALAVAFFVAKHRRWD
jgi:hypothetical protein